MEISGVGKVEQLTLWCKDCYHHLFHVAFFLLFFVGFAYRRGTPGVPVEFYVKT